MPTPPLPLLHALLDALNIPVLPPTLSATSPSLLLLIFETLLEEHLPLSPKVRSCRTLADELSLLKCLLGVLGSDVLGMDLTLVDPSKVVDGCEEEMAVVVMALAVVAKRRGTSIRLPFPEDDAMSDWSAIIDSGSLATLPFPLIPDRSFSSDPPTSPTSGVDVFGGPHDTSIQRGMITSAGRPEVYSEAPFDTHTSAVSTPTSPTVHQGSIAIIGDHDSEPQLHGNNQQSCKNSTGRPPNRTVLEQMVEEFGLCLEPECTSSL
ncbi:hypothetical protein BCR39DRAFT_220216 [Naematelia encephala]|uniref:DUF5745 domain-containing protein n=1 Tax=Naematelia encephala TaxID=71784 RepID=A0A1Y2B130_9TREE|nr:hypothetical protein BCR39DRAFT_220216 [Naematelia encephala]